MNRRYRAQWIDQQGQVVRDDCFDFDEEAHESFSWTRPEFYSAIALDADYMKLPELQAHVGGYIEMVQAEDIFVVINEEGLLLELPPQPHPAIHVFGLMYGALLVGPVVVVTYADRTRSVATQMARVRALHEEGE